MTWFKSKQSKNQAVFDQWVRDYHAALYRHALWMTGSADVAADMVQEAYYQAWSRMEQLQNPSKAFPWLLTILRRSVYREQRYQYRDMDTLDRLSDIDELGGDDSGYSLIEIYRLLESLSPVQRETFLLNALHGYSYVEISQQLNVPVGTVMSRISRAKTALKVFSDIDMQNVITLANAKKGGPS